MNKRHFTKNKYSTNAAKKCEEAELDAEARRAWARAREEHDRYIGLLDDLDIDEYAKENYLPSQTKITLRKLIIPSKKEGVDVVADFAGGYMRLQVRGTHVFLDKDWQSVSSCSYREMERKTHFRIKKMEEM